jgi:CheY-like chemotaxis protein
MGSTAVFNLVVSNSTVIVSQLRQGGFRRIDLHTQVVSTAANVFTLLARQMPHAVVLEARLPDGDAFDLCLRVREELGMEDLPLVVVTDGSISRALMRKAVSSGCDEVLSAPLSRGQLYDVLADYLGLPRRSHLRVNVLAQVTAQGGTLVQLKGTIYDLTVSGARIRLDQPFAGESPLTICIESSGGDELMLNGKVVWHRPYTSGGELAVQFLDVTEALAKRLEVLSTWRLEKQGDQQVVVLQRSLTERASFNGLAEQLKGSVTFDLRHLTLINSMGVSRWVKFLRGIPDEVNYSFCHCSVPFCTQASFIPEMVGRGRVTTFFAPYYCPACDREAERELHVNNITTDPEVAAPQLSCPSCGEQMYFEDIPERYLRFAVRPAPV